MSTEEKVIDKEYLTNKAYTVFPTKFEATMWMSNPLKLFNGYSPNQMVDMGKELSILEVLMQIKQGVIYE